MARCSAYVDVAAYRRNLAALRRLVGTPIWAVLKADAYGHGAVELARAALAADGIAGLAVATTSEGVALRDAGIPGPVLVFTPTDEVGEAAAAGLTLSVTTLEQLRRVGACPAERRPQVHVEVDSGMHRMGVEPAGLTGMLAEADALGVEVAGVYTHLSSADEDAPGPTQAQLGVFAAATEGLSGVMLHAANSAAALRFPAARLDAVRLGGATFGLSTGADEIFDVTDPVLSLATTVVRVYDLAPGEGVGYGLLDAADEPRRIAIVAAGYGDGLPRALSHGAPVLIRGRRCPIVGRVSMDFTAVDVGGAEVRTGDRAVLIGESEGERIRAEELARHAGTVSYEITTGLLARVPKIHVDLEPAAAADPASGPARP